jgi:hypothetical protein
MNGPEVPPTSYPARQVGQDTTASRHLCTGLADRTSSAARCAEARIAGWPCRVHPGLSRRAGAPPRHGPWGPRSRRSGSVRHRMSFRAKPGTLAASATNRPAFVGEVRGLLSPGV